jgi:hypothetical protein
MITGYKNATVIDRKWRPTFRVAHLPVRRPR